MDGDTAATGATPITTGLVSPEATAAASKGEWSGGDTDAQRFGDLGPIGRGGMGEVRRIVDHHLLRMCVRKEVLDKHGHHPPLLRRFVAEARITAQLDHPGIVPVLDVGHLPDGRPYYLMGEVRGLTLATAVRIHFGRILSTESYPQRRLLDALRRACETVAYAHSRGVIHRDLKPDNIMLGQFGAVMVLDWGIARVLDESDVVVDNDDVPLAALTLAGKALGTPGYLPPEQARGAIHEMGRYSDVFSLGAVLHHILTGRAPFTGTAEERLLAVVSRPASPLGPPVDPELARICAKALSPDPADRYPDAAAFTEALGDWLDGARRRERALTSVERADAHLIDHHSHLDRADHLRAQAAAMLTAAGPTAAPSDKAGAWALEDAADRTADQAALSAAGFLRELHGALQIDPTLQQAHTRLADWHRAEHEAAEARADRRAATHALEQLRTHDRGRHVDYLAGTARLSLSTVPPARLRLARIESEGRRRVATVLHTHNGVLVDHVIASGSWVVTATAPGHAPAILPIHLVRAGVHHAGPIPLLAENDLSEGDCYVPAGPFLSGGDPDAADALPQRKVWLDGFVMRRFPVTNDDYLAFLNDLVDRGHPDEAARLAPQSYRRGDSTKQATFGRTESGRFVLEVLDATQPWRGRAPVVSVSWVGAQEYARWRGEQDGLPWRLPHALEWEKAARGVDGRPLPWGDHLEKAWANVLGSRPGAPGLVDVDDYPEDVSIYGVRGLVGNVRDWCASRYRRDGAVCADGRLRLEDDGTEAGLDDADCSAVRDIRGGAAWNDRALVRPATRFGGDPKVGVDGVGFRLVRSVEGAGSTW